jgi:flagellar protein FliS
MKEHLGMTYRKQNHYQTTEILTADPGRLILLLYDGAIASLRMGKEKLQAHEYEEKAQLLMKAHDIVSELLNTLDVERGGEIAKMLKSIYGYLLKRIMDSDFHKDIDAIDEVISHLVTLRETWQEIIQKSPEDATIQQNECQTEIASTI